MAGKHGEKALDQQQHSTTIQGNKRKGVDASNEGRGGCDLL
jgi:hypothetical protein